MQTFLIVVAGVVVGLALFVALAIGWIKSKIGEVCESIVQLVKAGGIPPFRIRLDAIEDEPEWHDSEAFAEATNAFEAAGYTRGTDYEVREMEAVRVRALHHRETGFFAALYDHPEAGVFADVFQEFDDGTSVTITTAPESGLDQPTHAQHFRVEGQVREDGVARTLHDRLAHESIGRTGYTTRPEDFAHVFCEGYAQSMDWRIARGGVSRAEIERVAALSGEEPPSDCTVEMIQEMWRGAIGGFISDEVEKVWLTDSGMSAVEWEALRDRITVVHEKYDADEWLEDFAWRIVEDEVGEDEDDDAVREAAYERAAEQLRPVFEGRSLRDAFAEAQTQLPEKQRSEKLGSVEDPWPADVWASPEDDAY